jgi:hypothetical protein
LRAKLPPPRGDKIPAMPADAVLDWLLAGDPAIRWQTLRDLQNRPFQRERRRVATAGWGARLLTLQDCTGRFAEGLYKEFLPAHRLFRSHRTGEIVKSEFTRFHFPQRWHFDVLRGLDYFRAAGCARDPRLQDTSDLV